MGHKVHPYGFRIGIIKPWLAKWYADRDYATLLQEDMRIRELVARQLSNASVSQVEIERGINHVTVTVHTAKPGIVIGKGGANVEALRTNIGKLTEQEGQARDQGDPPARARRHAAGAERGRAAGAAHRLPQGDQAVDPAHHQGRRQGREDPGLRTPRRLRDEPHRVGQGGSHPARARCAPTSATAWSTPTPPTGASASRRGSTAASSSASARAAPAPSRARRDAAPRRPAAVARPRATAATPAEAAAATAVEEPTTASRGRPRPTAQAEVAEAAPASSAGRGPEARPPRRGRRGRAAQAEAPHAERRRRGRPGAEAGAPTRARGAGGSGEAPKLPADRRPRRPRRPTPRPRPSRRLRRRRTAADDEPTAEEA